MDGTFLQTVFLTDSIGYLLFRPFSFDDSGFSTAVLYFLVNKLIFMPQAVNKGFKIGGKFDDLKIRFLFDKHHFRLSVSSTLPIVQGKHGMTA
ncbi:Uncharacterised protein [Neisseria meningitidis]|nr:Uncharacterised protein [Neisseria meningitidis]